MDDAIGLIATHELEFSHLITGMERHLLCASVNKMMEHEADIHKGLPHHGINIKGDLFFIKAVVAVVHQYRCDSLALLIELRDAEFISALQSSSYGVFELEHLSDDAVLHFVFHIAQTVAPTRMEHIFHLLFPPLSAPY